MNSFGTPLKSIRLNNVEITTILSVINNFNNFDSPSKVLVYANLDHSQHFALDIHLPRLSSISVKIIKHLWIITLKR